MTETKFTRSGKNNPCPVCSRTKDDDCRTAEAANFVLCHSYTNGTRGELVNGYKFLHSSKDTTWGVWVWGQADDRGKISGRKPIRCSSGKQQYVYHDRDGTRLVQVTRIPKKEGGKTFAQSHWDGSNWVKGLDDYAKSRISVYRYPEVRQAIAQGKTIFMVEGEGVADALWKLGLPATTTIGGSKKYRTYGRYFEDSRRQTWCCAPIGTKWAWNTWRTLPRTSPTPNGATPFQNRPFGVIYPTAAD